MSTNQNIQSIQDTAAISFTSDIIDIDDVDDVFESNKLKKYRKYWWETGQIYPEARWEEAILPYKIATEVPYDTYVKHTDKYNIHGWWEWNNGTVCVVKLPSIFHKNCIGAISRQISLATGGVISTNADLFYLGATNTKTSKTGKEADASWRPVSKPPVNAGGSDTTGTQSWPNLVVEIAYTEDMERVRRKVEQYWLQPDRVHDVILIVIDKPITPVTTPSVMTAYHYCINNQDIGGFNPTMYEFGTIDLQGTPILNLQPGQRVINIQLACLYHGVPPNVLNPPPPSPPQLPPPNPFAIIPNPIVIDLYHVRFAVLNCIV
ncbi:hypothetical protein RhiirA5_411409 [Rhizophagus irregularis]|uniref:Restriction endonuclease domain-containing protein n=1 Tax=Rhizophagus irregularis TaxID=588596 RepID=A0A2N0Q119_9GLOM|nr:hypothetical protein RhiirA5_411409 [Rhizophagus irregularis]CAB5184468.1 unnamed protein product [Rhizophagus irregularis]